VAEGTRDIEPAVPVIWLLGKTGAGKTSLVRALTGEGEIGSGFAPGTRGPATYDFPATSPAVRFLDTRGLGEMGHDAGPDIAAAQDRAQAVLAVMRLDDPVHDPGGRGAAQDQAAGPPGAYRRRVWCPTRARRSGPARMSPN